MCYLQNASYKTDQKLYIQEAQCDLSNFERREIRLKKGAASFRWPDPGGLRCKCVPVVNLLRRFIPISLEKPNTIKERYEFDMIRTAKVEP